MKLAEISEDTGLSLANKLAKDKASTGQRAARGYDVAK